MAETTIPPLTVRFPRLARRGVILGLSGVQVGCIGAGLLLLVLAVFIAGVIGLVLIAPLVVALMAGAVVRVGGHPGVVWAARWLNRERRRVGDADPVARQARQACAGRLTGTARHRGEPRACSRPRMDPRWCSTCTARRSPRWCESRRQRSCCSTPRSRPAEWTAGRGRWRGCARAAGSRGSRCWSARSPTPATASHAGGREHGRDPIRLGRANLRAS